MTPPTSFWQDVQTHWPIWAAAGVTGTLASALAVRSWRATVHAIKKGKEVPVVPAQIATKWDQDLVARTFPAGVLLKGFTVDSNTDLVVIDHGMVQITLPCGTYSGGEFRESFRRRKIDEQGRGATALQYLTTSIDADPIDLPAFDCRDARSVTATVRVSYHVDRNHPAKLLEWHLRHDGLVKRADVEESLGVALRSWFARVSKMHPYDQLQVVFDGLRSGASAALAGELNPHGIVPGLPSFEFACPYREDLAQKRAEAEYRRECGEIEIQLKQMEAEHDRAAAAITQDQELEASDRFEERLEKLQELRKKCPEVGPEAFEGYKRRRDRIAAERCYRASRDFGLVRNAAAEALEPVIQKAAKLTLRLAEPVPEGGRARSLTIKPPREWRPLKVSDKTDEYVEFDIKSQETAGYLSLFNFGTDEDITLLYPNSAKRPDAGLQVQAAEEVRIPEDTHLYTIGTMPNTPGGKEIVHAFVTPKPITNYVTAVIPASPHAAASWTRDEAVARIRQLAKNLSALPAGSWAHGQEVFELYS